jgi:hypothetical protein
MFGDQERVTVRELMTEDPQEVHPAATVADVREWLDEKGYTAAPLARDEPPFMYVTRQGLADASAEAIDDPVYEHAERFGLDDLVAPDWGSRGSCANWRTDRSTSSAGTAASRASSPART